MTGKLAYFISIILILALFIGFNLPNYCDVSVIVYNFKDVPIFLSILCAFLFGTLAVFPFLIGHKKHSKKAEKQAAIYPTVEKVELKREKRGWFGKKKQQTDTTCQNKPSDIK